MKATQTSAATVARFAASRMTVFVNLFASTVAAVDRNPSHRHPSAHKPLRVKR
ncbi:MAG: hypothetical protein WBP46_16155 [Thiolinea sp.]